MAQRQAVSARTTLFLKWFLPVFWVCFMGSVTLLSLFFFSFEGIKPPFTPTSAKILIASFFLTSLGLMYLLWMRAKWVAVDENHIYVSNFFRSYRYTYSSIERIQEARVLFIFRRVTLHFHQPGAFGKSVFFWANYYWHHFLRNHPQVLEQILQSTGNLQNNETEMKGN